MPILSKDEKHPYVGCIPPWRLFLRRYGAIWKCHICGEAWIVSKERVPLSFMYYKDWVKVDGRS